VFGLFLLEPAVQLDTVVELLRTSLHSVRYYQPEPHQEILVADLKRSLEQAIKQLEQRAPKPSD
jgi:hypothetical protein